MGYDAFVPCNCFGEGRAEPPPVPVRWDAEEGTWEGQADDDRTWWAVMQWRETACEHRNMRLVRDRLANAADMADLRYAVWDLDLLHLGAALPVGNSGSVPAQQAALILPELEVLEGAELPQTFLWDSRGHLMRGHLGGEDATFFWFLGQRVGLGARGLYVEEDGEEVFRSRHFRQDVSGTGAVWTALDGPGQVHSGHVLRSPQTGEPADLLRVTSEVCASAGLARMAATLRALMTASVQSGNPVYWT